jgi:putative tricarboxylic transport membrane protein
MWIPIGSTTPAFLTKGFWDVSAGNIGWMYDILVWSMLGSLAGIVVGILPGVNNSTAMLMFYPLLLLVKPLNTIYFYVSMITVSAYHGSVAAILLGIPGEPECLPSMKEGLGMSLSGRTNLALGTAAVSSFLGSLCGVVFCAIIYLLGQNYYMLYNYLFQLFMISLLLGVTLFGYKDKLLTTLLLMITGYILGHVGYNQVTGKDFLTFGNPYLSSGLPLIVVIIFLYSIPLILSLEKEKMVKIHDHGFRWQLQLNTMTILRSSLIGFICGFMPMLSTILSANMAYSWEKYCKSGAYDETGDPDCLAASQAANHSGIIASLIPLFCFGIPIILSEGVLTDIMFQRGMVFNMDWIQHNLSTVLLVFLLANIAGILTSWPIARYVSHVMSCLMDSFVPICVIILAGIAFYMGYEENQLAYFSILALTFLPAGLLLSKNDMMPLVMCFLLSKNIDTAAHVVYNLYIN